MNEPTPIPHDSTSVATPGQSAAMPLSAFDPTLSLSMDPTFGNQYDNRGFGNSNDVDWSTLQAGNMPTDLWFDTIGQVFNSFPQGGLQSANSVLESTQPAFAFAPAGSQGPPVPMSAQMTGFLSMPPPLSTIQNQPMANPPSFLPGPSPNSDAQQLRLSDPYSPSLLPPGIIPTSGVNPPPSAPLPGTVVPLVAPPLASEYLPQVPSKSSQLPADGKENQAAPDGRRGGGDSGNKRGGAKKRKADDGMKDGGGLKPRKKNTKRTRETGEEAAEATVEDQEADRLANEAKAAQEAAKEAAKAAKAAAKAAKEAREAAKPGQATRSGRSSTLPDRFKEGGYAPPKRASRAKKST